MLNVKFLFFAILVLLISTFVYFSKYCYKDIDSTAKLVALARHCSLSLSPNNTIEDPYALGIDNYAQYFIKNDNLNTSCAMINYFSNEMASSFAQRAYYFDKQIIDHRDDYSQFVILGAGYDTRSKRFENFFTNITIFEVDLKHTQEKKKLVTDKLDWPSNVKFVDTDFNTQNLKNDLISKGYNPNLKTMFLLEGTHITNNS